MKAKDLINVLDIMDMGCDEYCSLGNCEEASGFAEHFDCAKDYYTEAKRWGMFK